MSTYYNRGQVRPYILTGEAMSNLRLKHARLALSDAPFSGCSASDSEPGSDTPNNAEMRRSFRIRITQGVMDCLVEEVTCAF